MSPAISWVRLTIVLLVTGALTLGSLYGSAHGALPGDPGNDAPHSPAVILWVVAAIAYGIQWLVFIPANAYETEKYYDLTGSITYLTCTIASLFLGASAKGTLSAQEFGASEWNFSTRAVVQSAMVIVWCLRLGSFLFSRISKDKKDGRFDEIKINPPRFLAAWTIQGMWVLLTALPVFIVNAFQVPSQPIGLLDYIGWVVWTLGFAIEIVADNQKSAFAADSGNKGKYINEGLWYYSRHPNYFGEMTLWFGQFLAATSILSGGQWVCAISPLFVIFLLVKVSGVPMLEKRSDEKFGGDVGYELYKQNTSCVVIWFKGTSTELEADCSMNYVPAP